MQEYFFRFRVREDGGGMTMEAMTRDQAIKALMRAKPNPRGAFTYSDDDGDDARLVKEAVAATGGVRQLAYALGVSREVFYSWVKRDSIPDAFRGKVVKFADRLREDDECED